MNNFTRMEVFFAMVCTIELYKKAKLVLFIYDAVVNQLLFIPNDNMILTFPFLFIERSLDGIKFICLAVR